jgi:hypothetical protein
MFNFDIVRYQKSTNSTEIELTKITKADINYSGIGKHINNYMYKQIINYLNMVLYIVIMI